MIFYMNKPPLGTKMECRISAINVLKIDEINLILSYLNTASDLLSFSHTSKYHYELAKQYVATPQANAIRNILENNLHAYNKLSEEMKFTRRYQHSTYFKLLSFILNAGLLYIIAYLNHINFKYHTIRNKLPYYLGLLTAIYNIYDNDSLGKKITSTYGAAIFQLFNPPQKNRKSLDNKPQEERFFNLSFHAVQ